jgi:hypothetical protein
MSNEKTQASTSPGDEATFNADPQQQSFDDMPVPMGPMAKHLGIEVDLPDNSDNVEDPEDSVDEVTPEEDYTDEDDTHDQEGDAEDDDEVEDDKSTQDTELNSEEEIDWDYLVPVKIDGE